MAALSERKLEIVRTLVETAPDRLVDGLQRALADASGDTALGSVRRLVETEARDRHLRNIVLLPIAPMCIGDGRDPLRLTFPASVMGLLWHGLKAQAPDVVHKAELALYDYRPGETSTEHFDRLVRLAAKGVRAGEAREFRMVAEICDQARADGAATLLACLDIAAIVRGVAHKLPEWTSQPGGGANIGARLAYKDAVAVSDDAGPRFFQMLAAQLQQHWMILRIISGVMEKPTERYLAETELGMFGQYILREIEEALKGIAQFDVDGGEAAAVEAARLVDLVTTEVNEMETYVSLSRNHGWGLALARHRNTLATTVEGFFREAEMHFEQALPCVGSRLKNGRRSGPNLGEAPDQTAVSRCVTLLTFAGEVRFSSNYGGFAAARAAMLEALGDGLDLYVEEVLGVLKSGEAEAEGHARAFLAVAAEFSALVRDEKAADLVRRRAAAAVAGPPVDLVQLLIAQS